MLTTVFEVVMLFIAGAALLVLTVHAFSALLDIAAWSIEKFL